MQNRFPVTHLKKIIWNFTKLEFYHGSMENSAQSEKLQWFGYFFSCVAIRNIYQVSMHNSSIIYIFKQYVRKIFGGFTILSAVSHFQSYKKIAILRLK